MDKNKKLLNEWIAEKLSKQKEKEEKELTNNNK